MMKATSWLVVAAVAASGASVAYAGATTEGSLVAKHGKEVVDIPLEHTEVAIKVDGFLADATVTQRFHNPWKTKIEAVYLFPLPEHAAITDLTIVVGPRRIRGAIHERSKAKQIYEAARDEGLVAALMTQERPNLFTQSLANLEPDATIDVTIHYVERLAYTDGGYEVVFPMVAVPRVGGAASVQPQVLPAGQRSAHDIALSVDLDAGMPIEAIASPSHRIVVDGKHVRIADGDTIPNKDFVLRYQVAGAATKFGALSHRDGTEGSFLFIAQPPRAPAVIAPREIVFALDTSSSMRGAPLAKAKELIRRVVATLRPDDTFQIVRFDDSASALGSAPIANKPNNIAVALDWLARLDAAGGTEMTTGIDAALALPHDPARLRIVAFVTDGYVGNEDEILKDVATHAGASRLFAFGVGSAVNRYLLDELASIGRGTAQFVRPDEDTTAAVEAFRARIDAPILTDIAVDWGGLAVADVTPRALPDLFAGQPLVISGHYARGGSATVTVRGRQDGRDVSFAVPVALADADGTHPAIATVWARRRIAELSRDLIKKEDPAKVNEIIALSLRYHILTQYTAFVAVDDSHKTTGDAKRVVVPVEIPAAVFGIGAGGFGVSGFGAGGGGSGYGTIGVGSYGTIGHGMAAHASYSVHYASVPTVMIAAPHVVGDLDKSIIRRYVKRQIPKITYCYERELQGKPHLDGTVTVQFVVGPDGKVLSSVASGLDEKVASCVADVIKAVDFPAATDGGRVQINYPFTFHSNVVVEENR